MKVILSRISATLFVVLLSFSYLAIFNVKAQSTTIIVPDDYSTIQEAINNANDGDTIFVRQGIHQDKTLKINKPLYLIAENINKTTITLDPPLVNKTIFHTTMEVLSTAIEINSDDVKISGFKINLASELIATGDRIQLSNNNIPRGSLTLRGTQIRIIENSINGNLVLRGSNQTITKNSIKGDLSSQNNYNIISENKIDQDVRLKNCNFNLISGNLFDKIYFEHCNSNFVCNNTFRSLRLGFYGNSCYNNTISKNKATGQYHWGILIADGSNNIIHDNLISNYTGGYGIAIGGNHYTAQYNLFYRNILTNNNMHVGANWEINGEGNSWDNGNEGNYWDNYSGEDLNGDGIGDAPYIVEGCKWDDDSRGHVSYVFGQDNYPLMFPFDINNVDIVLPEWAGVFSGPSPSPSPSTSPQEPEPFPTTIVIVSIAVLSIVILGIFSYRIKTKRKT